MYAHFPKMMKSKSGSLVHCTQFDLNIIYPVYLLKQEDILLVPAISTDIFCPLFLMNQKHWSKNSEVERI